ncbi:MAG: PEP-utilizing enzyme [Patescibacteria group bacterium]
MYQKEFTRDFSIIMEEVWHYAIFSGFKKEFGFSSPRRQPLVFYIKDGAIEVWSDKAVINSLIRKINVFSRQGPEKAIGILKNYQRLLKGFDKFFSVGFVRNQDKLEEFLERLRGIIASFTFMYYSAEYSVAPDKVKNYAQKIRLRDSFYDDCDRFLRRSLSRIFPEARGLETLILSNEIKRRPALAVLKKRKNNFILIPGYFQKITSLEKFARNHQDFVFDFPKINKSISDFKGTPAYQGKTVGRVRIVKLKDKMLSFKKGEILVAPMTTPDYLAIMKKAAAIVTDEGGLLCHAAIIAREMRTPCVIGTKIATQVLKDGNLVEVDAEKGVIKIIK